MKTLSCMDMGAMDCDFKAEGDTEAQVKEAMFKHAREAHPEKFTSMTPEQMQGAEEHMNKLLAAQA